MRDRLFPRGHRLTAARIGAVAATAVLIACNTDDILQVTDPDVARPEALQGATAIPTLRAGAIGNFGVAYNGGNADVEQIHLSGLLSDELINTETFPTRIEIDQRAMSLSNTSLIGTFFDLTRARASGELAIRTYQESAVTKADSTGFPEVLALNGMTYNLFAENYCGAVPVSMQNPAGTFTFVKEDKQGASPKFEIVDGQGVRSIPSKRSDSGFARDWSLFKAIRCDGSDWNGRNC